MKDENRSKKINHSITSCLMYNNHFFIMELVITLYKYVVLLFDLKFIL